MLLSGKLYRELGESGWVTIGRDAWERERAAIRKLIVRLIALLLVLLPA